MTDQSLVMYKQANDRLRVMLGVVMGETWLLGGMDGVAAYSIGGYNVHMIDSLIYTYP